MKLPLKIVYNTDYYKEVADAEDIANRYVSSVDDAEGKTVCYTEDGYFNLSEETAQQIVTAVNTHAELVAALRNLKIASDAACVVMRQSESLPSARGAAMGNLHERAIEAGKLLAKVTP